MSAKSTRQRAYEVGVEFQLATYKRSRKVDILKRRFVRLISTLDTDDLDWLGEQLSKRFPDTFKALWVK